eukprot:m.768550 g.768550  ORF g.768550 m.768550 type:complete len:103 (-) comp23228_c0_seq5:2547-2855(-)
MLEVHMMTVGSHYSYYSNGSSGAGCQHRAERQCHACIVSCVCARTDAAVYMLVVSSDAFVDGGVVGTPAPAPPDPEAALVPGTASPRASASSRCKTSTMRCS